MGFPKGHEVYDMTAVGNTEVYITVKQGINFPIYSVYTYTITESGAGSWKCKAIHKHLKNARKTYDKTIATLTEVK